MLSVEKCRELLGDKSLTDEQIEALRADLYEIAQLAFETWVHEKYGSKYPIGSLPQFGNKDTV
jgi:hypothetical protein